MKETFFQKFKFNFYTLNGLWIKDECYRENGCVPFKVHPLKPGPLSVCMCEGGVLQGD